MTRKIKKLSTVILFTLKEIFIHVRSNNTEKNCGEDECGGDGLNIKNKL